MTENNQNLHKISEYFSGEHEQETVKSELEQHPESSELFNWVNAFWTKLHPHSPESSEKIRQLTLQKINQKKKSKNLLFWNFAKYAAIFILLISTGTATYYYINKETNPNIITVYSGIGEVKSVSLPDGSVAWLNALSQMSYPEKFTNKREVKITGEVYFEVEHDEKNTFTVHSKYVNIEVYGTKFMISTYGDNPNVSTCLFEGSIAMEVPTIKKTLELRPGNLVTLEKSTMNITKEENGAEGLNKWISGGISFYNEPLSEIAKKLQRKFGTEIAIEGHTIQSMKLTADFEEENLDQILNYMCSYAGLKFEKTKKGYIIKLN